MLMQDAISSTSRPLMPQLLVSVRDAAEARIAIDEGVRLIDVKEPRGGSLGAASISSVRQIADICGSTHLLSVALGELLDPTPLCFPEEISPTFVKCGLSGCGRRADWSDVWQKRMAKHAALAVAVVYADWKTAEAPSPMAVISHAVDVRCRTVLLDTFDKSKGNLLQHMTLDDIWRWIATVQKRGMKAVVAGSLTQAMVGPLLEGGADCIALRGAACRGGRSGTIDRSKLRSLIQEVTLADVSHRAPLTV